MLQKVNFAPGFNKQKTATGAEGEWVSGDYVRFRYNSPEKIGVGLNWEMQHLPEETPLYIILSMHQVSSMLH